MRLPDKITPFSLSSLPLLVFILKALEKDDLEPSALVSKMEKQSHSLSETIEALDMLFALGRVEFDGEARLHYVAGS